jgi:membrane fusion protein (multidrug efflux system)
MTIRMLIMLTITLVSAAGLASKVALGDEASAPSVLVATVPALPGDVPEILTAYGSAEPAPNGTSSISLLRSGQVVALHVSAGQAVRNGDPLLEFGADPAALATYEQAVSTLEAAKRDREQTAALVGQQLATRAQLAHADKAVADARSALDALDRAGGGKRSETIRAPFDAVVASVAVAQGDRLQAAAPMLQLIRLDRLVVAVGIDPAQRGKVAVGAPAHLEPLDGESEALGGTVASVAGAVDAKTRLIECLIQPATGQLLPGAAYRVGIEVGRYSGWLVPREAVLLDDEGAHLFQVKGGKAVQVPVRLIGQSGEESVVDGAIDPAAPIVASGSYQLTDGAVIRLQPPETRQP